MSLIRLAGWAGENRALHPLLLPESVGVVSTNQKPGRGDLRPWKSPLSTNATVPSGRTTIYRMGLDVASDTNYWLSWVNEVHAVRGPNAIDSAERTYFTGFGTPKWTNTTLALSAAPYPTAYRELGVPPPTTIPVLTSAEPSAIAASALVIDQLYEIITVGNTDWLSIGAANEVVISGNLVTGTVYTVRSVGTTNFALFGAVHPVVVAGGLVTGAAYTILTLSNGSGAVTNWVLCGASANTVGISFIANSLDHGTGTGTVTKNDLTGVVFTATANGNGTGTVTKNDLVGQTFVATAVGSGTGTAKATSITTETRYYVYTTVTDIGEESAPSLPSLPITLKQNAIVTLTSLSTPSGIYQITRYRIYRTETGSSTTQFYFLREISSSLVTTTDDNRTLGEVLPTTDWIMPPTDLNHLTGMWNGMMAGISGRSVRFCEAYVPYAWPIAYEVLASNITPVALGTFGQTLVILTNKSPIMVSGGTPDSMDEQPTSFLQSCISSRSVVSVGHGVIWASPDGLAYIGQSGPRLLTDGLMLREDWQALNPSSIIGCMFESRYFGFYTVNNVKKGFVIETNNAAGIYFFDFGVDAVYVDILQDALYILDGVNIKKWDLGTALTVTFKSKLFRSPKPTGGFCAAEVTADAYPVTFKLYADGVLKHTQTVTSSVPFRLPSGYNAQTSQIEISGNTAIQGVAIAHSMLELAAA